MTDVEKCRGAIRRELAKRKAAPRAKRVPNAALRIADNRTMEVWNMSGGVARIAAIICQKLALAGYDAEVTE